MGKQSLILRHRDSIGRGHSFERDPVMKSHEVDINGELIGRFRRSKQEIAHFAPGPMQLKVRNAEISAVLMNSMSGLPGR